MKQAQIKLLFDVGHIKKPVITHSMMSQKWQLMFDVKEKKQERTVVLESKRGKVRQFSTIEAAIKLLEDIGFKSVNINFK